MARNLADFRFTVFERQERKGWYYRYWITDTRRSSSLAISTLVRKMGLSADYPVIKNRRQAEQIVTLAYERGIIRTEMGSGELLGPYLKMYWDYNGTRITRLNKRRPGAVSENYANIMAGYIRNHILPQIGKKMAISEVSPRFVRDLSNKLLDSGKLANATIDKIMVAFTKPLVDAWKDDMIHENPTKLVEKMDTRPVEPKGILTRSELQQVLVVLKNRGTEHTYLAVLLAAATAMRLGEIRALQRGDITIVNEMDSIITVSKSWSVYGGEKSTKGKKVRYVPCPTWMARKLYSLGMLNPHGTELVFWSIKGGKDNPPVSSNYIRDSFYLHLYDVLEFNAGVAAGSTVNDVDSKGRRKLDKNGKPIQIRYGEVLRRERNITFHSFRHFFNTEAQALGADTDKLRLTVGHESKDMTDLYTHAENRLDMIKPIAEISHMIVGQAEMMDD